MLRRCTSITPDKRERGFRAEARFFYIVENGRQSLRPRGFAHIARASPLLDARGVDGFVYHYRGSQSSRPSRIPIQLKTGYDGTTGHDQETAFGILVPIVPISVDMDLYNMFDRIRRLLDSHDREPRAYEDALCRMESTRPSNSECVIIDMIASCREQYPYPPIPERSLEHA